MLSFGSSFFSPLAAAGNFAISKEGFFLFFFLGAKEAGALGHGNSFLHTREEQFLDVRGWVVLNCKERETCLIAPVPVISE